MLYIFPILFVTYKFIRWIRYSKYLKSIVKVTKFDEILSYGVSPNSNLKKKEFLVSIYTYINSNAPLVSLRTITNNINSTSLVNSITTTETSTLNSSAIGDAINKVININSSSTGDVLNNSYLAVESTKLLIFQCSRSASGVSSTILSKLYNSVPSLKLTDIENNSIEVIADDIQFPLEKTFSNYIPSFPEEPQYIKILDYIFGRKKLIGQLFEERVFKPNLKLFTVLSCRFDAITKSIQYRILNLPFQFSESKLDKEIEHADFKTQMYGSFLIGFGVSILVYYGVPLLRDYLFKLKLNKTKAATPEEMQRTCAVCYEQSRDIVFIPCNHVLTCNSCSGFIHSCPLCRSQITSKRRLIF